MTDATDPIAAAVPVCVGISYQLGVAGYSDASDYLRTDYMRGYVAATLADALEAERAKVAAAYEAAASVLEDRGSDGWAENLMAEWSSVYAESIRALTPADAQAALDKLLAEARLEGWRAGRDQAHVGLAAVQREVAQFSATHGNIGPKEASHG